MAMISCGECGNAISSRARRCPKCGVRLPAPKGCAFLAFAVLALFIVGLIGSLSSPSNSTPKRTPPPGPKPPPYAVLDRVKLMTGGVHLDVLAGSLSRNTPVSERAAVARRIAAIEGADVLLLYGTQTAYSAMYSASIAEEYPEAMAGFLGEVKNGRFTAPDAAKP